MFGVTMVTLSTVGRNRAFIFGSLITRENEQSCENTVVSRSSKLLRVFP